MRIGTDYIGVIDKFSTIKIFLSFFLFLSRKNVYLDLVVILRVEMKMGAAFGALINCRVLVLTAAWWAISTLLTIPLLIGE